MNKIAISLGVACEAAMYGVNNNLRKRKCDGYMTCPFDEMISNYNGVIECILNDFEGFTDDKNLDIIIAYDNGEKLIKNTKYNFIFNHESFTHANLYLSQNWKEGENHYYNNNYYWFKERYNSRINNFRKYIKEAEYIYFIIDKKDDEISLLNFTLKLKYPNLKFEIIRIKSNGDEYYNNINKKLNIKI